MIGKYKIIDKLGQGGFGAVYKVSYKGNVYALKTYDPSLPRSVDDLNKEYEIGIKVTGDEKKCHPFIACVYEKGYDIINNKKQYYLVMEYIEGGDLSKIINLNMKKQFINDDGIIKIIDYIIHGIDYLHSQQIIHMDIKPANIMFNRNQLKLKIIDMGLACLNYFDIDDPKFGCFNPFTNTGFVSGTQGYLSPEMFIISKYINTNKMRIRITKDMYIKNDMWALGVTFAQLCSYPVFDDLGEFVAEEMEKSIYFDASFNSAIYTSPVIKEIIEGCLKSHYNERFNTKQIIKILDTHYGRDVDMS